jgi:hypothetical protein
MKNMTRKLSALFLTLCLALSLTVPALAAGTVAKVEDDVWTVNFYSDSTVTVTRLKTAYLTSLTGLTVGGTTYDVATAVSQQTDTYGNVVQATWTGVDYAAPVQVVENARALTIEVDGVSRSYSRADLAGVLTTGQWSYSGSYTGTKDDGADSYVGVATQYITIPDLLSFLGVTNASSVSFRPVDWNGQQAYIRTLSSADAIQSAVLALKSYQSHGSTVSPDQADTLNAWRLLPSQTITTGFDSVKWVDHITVTTSAASGSGSEGGSGGGAAGTAGGGAASGGTTTTGGATTGGGTSAGGTTTGGSTSDIVEPDVPLAGDATLNRVDHFAYIMGYTDGTVRPTNSITRQEVAAIFYRLLTDASKAAYYTEENSFRDVDSSWWSNAAISTLANIGVINGYPDGTFRPLENISREEFAAMAAHFAAVTEAPENPFSDTAGRWSTDLISFAYREGWVTGYTDGTFRPTEDISRAETMAILNRVLEREVDETGVLPGCKTFSDNTNPQDWYYYHVIEATNSHDYQRQVPGKALEAWTALTDGKA